MRRLGVLVLKCNLSYRSSASIDRDSRTAERGPAADSPGGGPA
ncbi:hypothetical protein CSB92_6630 [Pseudomonas aeruginosa]|nr:hypothetical protein CSC30_1086 [Pseudomonas aeruginosa]AWF69067.1 hypothetical protein CSC27_3367 [Pseudomonas aeruginosa]AZP61238.1 Uncharacterized protein PA1840_4047 [Pseudomonas aeruginosa]PRW11332.1 hypothetical protein CSB92_6630 [Pseudomonas aeruginosa]QJE77355.1 Uncharacterized protein PA52Ts1_2397 [Pseudomonas aeruginosa]